MRAPEPVWNAYRNTSNDFSIQPEDPPAVFLLCCAPNLAALAIFALSGYNDLSILFDFLQAKEA